MVGIYKISSPTGRVYIGQSWNIRERFRRYRSMKCERQVKLFASFSKYGVNDHVFEVIHELPSDISQTIFDEYEKLYIIQYKECEIELMNLQEGGSNGKHSEETKEKIRAANTGVVFSKERLLRMSEGIKGKPSPMKGKRMSEETKLKLSRVRTGKVLSLEHRRKISEGIKGRTLSLEHRLNVSRALKGRQKSPEHVEKIRQKLIGQKRSEECRRKMSEQRRGKKRK